MKPQDPTHIDLPELIALQNSARGLDLRMRRARARRNGQYTSPAKGRGMEFSESRAYQPGDDVRNIDWPVTARSGNTHTKLFAEERERPLLISVDARSSMFFATQGCFKSVLAAEFAALIAWSALQAGDRVGGEIYNRQRHTEYRPKRGKRSLLHMLKQLAELQPVQDENVLDASMASPLTRLKQLAHPGSLVCLISDFRGFDEVAESRLADIARHSQVILIHLYDRLEMRLPERGRYRVSNGQRILDLDTANRKVQQNYAGRYLARVNRLEQLCSQRGISWLQCATGESPLAVLRYYFARRQVRTHG